MTGERAAIFEVGPAPALSGGRVDVTGDARLSTPTAAITTGTGTPAGGAVAQERAQAVAPAHARVLYDPLRKLTTVQALAGAVRVTPTNRALRVIDLRPGEQVGVTPGSITLDLSRTIPHPHLVRAGPASATAPARLSLRSLLGSHCVRVGVQSARPARVLLTLFAERPGAFLVVGQRLVRFAAPGRKTACVPVSARARSLSAGARLRFALGYSPGLRARAGQPKTKPAILPIALGA